MNLPENRLLCLTKVWWRKAPKAHSANSWQMKWTLWQNFLKMQIMLLTEVIYFTKWCGQRKEHMAMYASNAAKYQTYHTYLQVQQWLGSETILPTDWVWCLSDGKLKPDEMDAEVAPACVLRLISCGCKTGFHITCTCRNNGLKCAPMCSRCGRNNCSNCEIDADEL